VGEGGKGGGKEERGRKWFYVSPSCLLLAEKGQDKKAAGIVRGENEDFFAKGDLHGKRGVRKKIKR